MYQVVNQGITNTGIYDFMNELANLKIIDLTSVIKPYSRELITMGFIREIVSHNYF